MGYLNWYCDKYNREQLTHCKRLISDMETMETQLYAVVDFMADAKLAPKGIVDVAALIEKVKEMKHNFESDVKQSKRKD